MSPHLIPWGSHKQCTGSPIQAALNRIRLRCHNRIGKIHGNALLSSLVNRAGTLSQCDNVWCCWSYLLLNTLQKGPSNHTSMTTTRHLNLLNHRSTYSPLRTSPLESTSTRRLEYQFLQLHAFKIFWLSYWRLCFLSPFIGEQNRECLLAPSVWTVFYLFLFYLLRAFGVVFIGLFILLVALLFLPFFFWVFLGFFYLYIF